MTRVEIGEGTPTGRALLLNQPIIIADARKDTRLQLPQFMREHGVVSSLVVVVQGRGRAFGGLGVHTTKPRTFNADDVRFLESIGNILATGIARIQFEHELRDTGSRLRGIVETAVDGIITIDERGIVETMNPAAERIFEYNSDEVIGRNISMLMPEPYRSEHDGYLERYHRTGERRIIGIGREVKGRRKDGSEFPMDLAVSATKLGDRRIFTGLVRDITARKQLEQEILEISDREQRRIGSDLHDDLCQRLAGIDFLFDAPKENTPKQTAGNNASDSRSLPPMLVTRSIARECWRVGWRRSRWKETGLSPRYRSLARSIHTLFKIKSLFRSKGAIEMKDPIAATHLYRITQEAINDAVKHAQATQIIVSLEEAATEKITDNRRRRNQFCSAGCAAHHWKEWGCGRLRIAPE